MAGRRWVPVLVGLVLATSSLGAVAAAPEDAAPLPRAAKATRLTLVASADEVDHGATVTLSGKLTSGGKGLKRQKVVIKHRVNGAKTWSKVGTVTTKRKGTWRKAVQVRLRGQFMAVYRGSRSHAASKSPARTVDVFAFLTDYAVAPGGRDAYKDEPWTFTGRTAAELAGAKVTLERGPNRAPTTVATGTVGPGGAIALTHRMVDVGQQDYWLSVPETRLMYGADSPHTSIRTRSQGAPTPPTVTTSSLPSVEVHVPYQATLLVSGGEVTWSVVGGSLPPGLELAPDGTLSGAPAATGTWSFTVRASNVAGAATRDLSLAVAPGSLTVTTYRLTDAAVGLPYPTGFFPVGWQPMTCTPCGEGVRWTVTAGALPPGMDLDRDELVDPPLSYVFGTPTLAGRYVFTVTAVIATAGRSGSRQMSVNVLPSAADMLQIDVDPFTLRIPDATLGEPYSYQFLTNTDRPLTWTAITSLPPGLTLSPGGLLSGTPTKSGDGWIDVGADDGDRYDWEQVQIAVDG